MSEKMKFGLIKFAMFGIAVLTAMLWMAFFYFGMVFAASLDGHAEVLVGMFVVIVWIFSGMAAVAAVANID